MLSCAQVSLFPVRVSLASCAQMSLGSSAQVSHLHVRREGREEGREKRRDKGTDGDGREKFWQDWEGFKWFYAYAIRPVTEELDARRVRLAGHRLWAPSDDPLDS